MLAGNKPRDMNVFGDGAVTLDLDAIQERLDKLNQDIADLLRIVCAADRLAAEWEYNALTHDNPATAKMYKRCALHLRRALTTAAK